MNFFDFLFRTGGFRRPSAGTEGQNSGCPPGFLSLSAPVPRCGMPYLRLKDCRAALRPRNDTKSGRFYLENNCFLFYAVIFCTVAPHRFSNASFRKLFRFPAKPTRFVIARRAHFSARRGNLKVEGMGSRNEVCKHETRQGKKQNVLVPNVEHIPFCSVFPCFVPGCRFVPSKIAASLCSSQ